MCIDFQLKFKQNYFGFNFSIYYFFQLFVIAYLQNLFKFIWSKRFVLQMFFFFFVNFWEKLRWASTNSWKKKKIVLRKTENHVISGHWILPTDSQTNCIKIPVKVNFCLCSMLWRQKCATLVSKNKMKNTFWMNHLCENINKNMNKHKMWCLCSNLQCVSRVDDDIFGNHKEICLLYAS